MRRLCTTLVLALAFMTAAGAQPAPRVVNPVVIVETARGQLTIELFAAEAPVSVAHVVALIKQRFYDGVRVHRALPGFLVQFGDPQSRDDSKRAVWGRGSEAASGKPVGVAEISAKRLHGVGTVGLSHLGDPARADSQLYITLAPRRDLDTRYAIVGQVIDGADTLPAFQVGDEITRAYLRP